MGIEELNKKPGEPCPHCTDNGCAIYDERPEVCKGFNCVWRFDVFKDKKRILRPDILGVVLIHKSSIEGFSPAVQFNAPKASHFANPTVKLLANSLRKNGMAVALVSTADDMDSILLKPTGN
jgi:Fe-S-cluster containining protein